MRTVKGLDNSWKALQDIRALRLDTVPPSVQQKTDELFGDHLTPTQAVERILEEVRKGGDEALKRLTRKIDGVDVPSFLVPPEAVADAYSAVPDELVQSLELAESRIRKFQEAALTKGWMDLAEGYGELIIPMQRVGAYVPGGTAPLLSSVLMTAIPAKVAGVREVIVATPSGEGGLPDPGILVAADISGVDRVFRISGAQAIAAMAYGTETVPRVDMICGPGGVFTTLAKKLLYGEVGIDGLYGPTETVVIADDSANPTLCAADLVAQAEHDAVATAVLITTSEDIAAAVVDETEIRASRVTRSSITRASLEDRGIVAVVDTLEEAFELSNRFAPEHVSLMVKEPWRHVRQVLNAGVVFLGDFSHEVLGDYVAGPSHVMPTGGTARFNSGLNVRSFQKVMPVVGLDRRTAASVARHAAVIARAEGLTGHAESAEIRDELSSQD